MKFLDLFAGIGGFRFGMESVGHECVGFVEWDKYARKSYEAIHDTRGEWTRDDITKITDEEWRELHGTVDVICGGFPCQSFSVAGRRGGFEDTRGTMFFEIARAVKQVKSRILLLENVKGLLSHDKGRTFGTILNTLDELGYDVEWQVCNTKNFGLPQNRERVFLVGHLRGSSTRQVFPIRQDTTASNIEIIGNTKINFVDPKKGQREMVYSPNGSMGALTATDYKQPKRILVKGNLDMKGHETLRRVYDEEGISPSVIVGQDVKVAIPVLTPDRLEKRQNGRRFKEDGDPMFTLTAQDRHGVMVREATKTGFAIANEGDSINLTAIASKTRRGRVGKGIANTLDTGCNQGVLEGYRIRKLTPKECWRLQGFPDWAFEKASEDNSDTQLYKQAGNAVSIPVVQAIAERLGVEDE